MARGRGCLSRPLADTQRMPIGVLRLNEAAKLR